jgi:DNA-binding GntR family transcriptional regulator
VLNPRGPVPLYQQVAEQIRQRIVSGALTPGQPAPSETQIMAEFGVARITARKAVEVLRAEGLIHTIRGKGSYVGAAGTPLADSDTKARRIAAELAAEIRAGQYEQDIPLPSETTLAQRFDAAKGTIRQAIALLREQGWVYTVPQRGTYVFEPEKWPRG